MLNVVHALIFPSWLYLSAVCFGRANIDFMIHIDYGGRMSSYTIALIQLKKYGVNRFIFEISLEIKYILD